MPHKWVLKLLESKTDEGEERVSSNVHRHPPHTHEVKLGNSGECYVQSRVRIRANPKASMALEGTPESEGRTGP